MRTARRLLGSAFLGLLLLGLAHAGEDDDLAPIGEWDALAKEIVPKYVRKNISMADMFRNVRRARATGHVTMSTSHNPGPFTGKIKYTIDDLDDDGEIAASEVEAEALGTTNVFFTSALGKLCMALKQMTVMSMAQAQIFEYCNIETQKTPTGYLLKLEPAERRLRSILGFLEGTLTITKDFRATALHLSGVGVGTFAGVGTSRSEAEMTFRHRRLGDKWLAAGYTKKTKTFATSTVDDVTFGYTEIEGMQVLTRLTSVSTVRAQGLPTVPPTPSPGGHTVRLEVKFTGWKFKKR